MRNKKLILVSMVAILVLSIAAGCSSSSEKQTKVAAPAAASKSAAAMPNEDPMPIAQDLERKLKDTATMAKESKWPEARIIAAEAVKTNDRLIVHITDTRLRDALRKSVNDVNEAVKASPADAKNTEAKIAIALENVKQAGVQLQGHKHH